ncbi:S8 family peptidase [Aquincola sp. J276]|uniref:S8 family peptidase n=1 Tax=Aquincola sp. J276 TaxID=2898432 RepID=UPI002150D629|nr:S8 family peptidase [Aquincola sp. J276]MCR5868019.1 S8 family peptidase [Aquincola sp. J276]
MATSPSSLHRSIRGRRAAWWPACAAAVLLAACGSGEPDGAASAAAPSPDTPLPSAAVADRRFVLWQPGTEAAVQAEQAALAGQATDEARLVVRMNPAAVPPVPGRAVLAGAAGHGESGDASALRARELSAKASAVATAADEVTALSIRRLAPDAAVRQHFAHAIEGFVVSVPWRQAQAVADELARNPAVDAVELDRPLTLEQTAPTVRTLDARAWGVDRIDQRARAFDGAFRNAYTGQGVTVHVVDSGVSPHAQFGSRLRSGFSAITDGNGTRDCHGHGTHVAGTAAGATVGVAPGASVVPVRVMDCSGSGSSSAVIAGLDWIAAHGSRPGVVNMSIGGPAFSSLDAAAQRLVAAGFSVVAAAGNSNVDACTQSPGRAPGLLTVAATDSADAKAAYSNWGSCVALFAPGSSIASAGIASTSALAVMSGTSMASPHVAGAAALWLQAQPAATAAQVRQLLLQDATPNTVLGLTSAQPGTPRSLLHAGTAAAPSAAPAAPAVPAAPSVALRTGSITLATAVPFIGAWTAHATVQVQDAQGKPVPGVKVAARFSSMPAELSCTTAASGSCRVTSAAVPWGAVSRIGFAVTGLSGAQMMDSLAGSRQAQVAQPAAPVASVAAISGTAVRPSAGSAQWAPQFTVALADDKRAAVPGAVVYGVLRIHSGARVVGLQTLLCQTAANGQCMLRWTGPALGSAHTGAVLEVLSVDRPFLVYQPGSLKTGVVGRVN